MYKEYCFRDYFLRKVSADGNLCCSCVFFSVYLLVVRLLSGIPSSCLTFSLKSLSYYTHTVIVAPVAQEVECFLH